jgi:hypothetical protein
LWGFSHWYRDLSLHGQRSTVEAIASRPQSRIYKHGLTDRITRCHAVLSDIFRGILPKSVTRTIQLLLLQLFFRGS